MKNKILNLFGNNSVFSFKFIFTKILKTQIKIYLVNSLFINQWFQFINFAKKSKHKMETHL